MSARLRIELFPSSLSKSIDFYTTILSFNLLRHEPDSSPTPDSSTITPDTGYAYLSCSTITRPRNMPPSSYPSAAVDPVSRAQFRRWPTGVELVVGVNDVDEEMRRIVEKGCPLESGMELQEWGLRDFRIVDPDGYYWRISERGSADGKGKGAVRE